MPLSDLVSVSSLKLTDVTEAAGVLLASMSRDSFFQCKLPQSQRDFDKAWSARVQNISASLHSILKYPYTVILVARYVPDNRIIGTISTYHINASEMRWSKPDTEALLQGYTFYSSHLTKEVSMPFLNQYTLGHERAFKDCDITGRFWCACSLHGCRLAAELSYARHMDGICTLTGFEGKGIGSKLIDALFSRLARMPEAPRKVFVMSNSNSRRIYEDHGFKLSSTVKTMSIIRALFTVLPILDPPVVLRNISQNTISPTICPARSHVLRPLICLAWTL